MKNKDVLKAPKTIILPAIDTTKIITLLLGTLLTCKSITLTIICLLTKTYSLFKSIGTIEDLFLDEPSSGLRGVISSQLIE